MSEMKKYTTATFREMKEAGEPIVMVTAYDYPTAKLAEEAGAEMILVGDSLGMVVLGYDSTIPVTLEEMIHHTKAVARAAKKAFVVTDMPFMTYRLGLENALKNATRIMQEGQAKAVKMEGGRELCPIIEQLVRGGIPVVGHLGLTPQSVHQLGGYKVQGKSIADAEAIIDDALALQEAGVHSLVLECVPRQLAKLITEMLDIPTIGIGAGPDCDGQVLVFHDLAQYASEIRPKFVKSFGAVGEEVYKSFANYAKEVKSRQFPTLEHSFSMNEETIQQLYSKVNANK